MKHIALAIPTLARIGGAERQLILLAKGLLRRGWRVSVVALSGTGGSAAGELTAAGAGFLSLEMRKGLADPRGWIRFHRWLRREAPDVLHAHLPHAAWLARWSRLAAPVRAVVDTLHSSSTGSLGRRLGYRWSGWLTDRTTAVSQAVAEAHLAAAMTKESELTVLPNGVDAEAWRPDAAVRAAVRGELGLADEFLWLAAGRLEAVKDYPTLLHAMAEIAEPARLVIAGSGPLGDELSRLTSRLGLAGRVRFLGFEPDLLRWMQAADGFVLSSRWEGLPMGVLEACACGLPVVATDVPGTWEAIADGQTGFLVAAGSATALASALIRTMRASSEDRRGMGERARQRTMERYGLESVLDRWEALYRELLERNPKPRRWRSAR
jgi:glycosyltransferase involved in cell wall biosynthesis